MENLPTKSKISHSDIPSFPSVDLEELDRGTVSTYDSGGDGRSSLPPRKSVWSVIYQRSAVSYIVIIGEFVLEYSKALAYGILISSISNEAGYIPLEVIHSCEIQTQIGYSLGIIFGWLTDSYIGKFNIYLISLVIYFLISMLYLVILLPRNDKETSVTSLVILAHSYAVFSFSNGPRDMFVAEQVKLSEDKASVRLHLFLVVWVRSVAQTLFFILCLLIFDFKTFLILSAATVALATPIYFTVLILIRENLNKEPVQRYAVEKNIVKCSKARKSSPDRSDLEAKPGYRFRDILFLFLPFISFGSLNMLLHKYIFNNLEIFFDKASPKLILPYVIETSSLTILLPISEFVLFYIKKFRLIISDLMAIVLASFFLGVSAISCLSIQSAIGEHVKIPTAYSGQIILFNGLDTEVAVISSLWANRNISIKSTDKIIQVVPANNRIDVPLNYYTASNKSTPQRYMITVENSYSLTYFIGKEGFWRDKDYDPIFHGPATYNSAENPTTFFLPASQAKKGDFVLENINSFSTTRKHITNARRVYFNVKPGTYLASFEEDGNVTFKTKKISLEADSVYAFVLFESGTIKCENIYQRTSDHFYIFALLPLIFRNFAFSLCLVPLYHFTYVESPPTVRSFLYSYVLFTEFCGFGFHLIFEGIERALIYDPRVIIIYLPIHFTCLITLIVFSCYYKFGSKHMRRSRTQ